MGKLHPFRSQSRSCGRRSGSIHRRPSGRSDRLPVGRSTTLYLRELRQKMGGPSIEAGKLDFRLTISVHDDDNLLGEVSDQFQNGVARLIDLPVKGSNDAPYRIALAPRLRKDITIKNRWVIKIPLFNIDKPIGCAFPLTVPMGSSAAGRTREPSGRIIKWQVRHIGPPPAN